jgi:hypothetical protein
LNGPLYVIGADSEISVADDSLASRMISPKTAVVQRAPDVTIIDKGIYSGQMVHPAFYNTNNDSSAVDVLWGDKKWRVKSEKLNVQNSEDV